jgi:hypothetical protein
VSKLPAQIKKLMRNEVTWEGFIGQDGFTDEIYTEPRTIKCWIEEKGGFGGVQRNQTGSSTLIDPKVDVYMDPNDIDPSTVTMRDRWTYAINGQEWQTQADRIAITNGPDGSPWLLVATL